MTIGTLAAVRSLPKRLRWERANINVAIMLDWDDVQAVATRALTGSPEPVQTIWRHSSIHPRIDP
jgi:hypothetical protein